MSELRAFLKQNKIKKENMKFAASKNFVDENGNTILWEIKAISAAQDNALRDSCIKNKKVPGKKNTYLPELDFAEYSAKLAAMCTVFPNLKDVELQNSYGVMGEDKLLLEMLDAGEYNAYCDKITEINGFQQSAEEMIEYVKN